MSAIGGVIGKKTGLHLADKMLSSMCKRGFGGKESYIVSDCCMLHTNDKTNEPEKGNSIVHLELFDEKYIIVFNGKLFNKTDVCAELKRQYGCFLTMSDADVVLHAYACYKEKALALLNGVFSFAIWHCNEKKLFIARDRIGVKPLFYKVKDGVLWFASEIKTILQDSEVPAEIDNVGIAQLLLLGPGRIPGSGLFKDICELKPGCYCEFCNGKLIQRQYWRLSDREHTESFEDTADRVRYLVIDSIERQMDNGDSVGTFLSGGLDSSIISSVCAAMCRKTGRHLKTFSVDYRDHEKYFISNKFQPENDRMYIDIMHRYVGSEHHDIILGPEDLAQCIDDATVARDLPGMGDVDFSLMAFCANVSKHVPVTFSGECADEIFGGYPWYRDPEIRASEGFPWAQNTSFRAEFIRHEHLKEIDPISFVMDLYKETVYNSDIHPSNSQFERRMKELVNLNFDWFMQTLIDRNDRMSMHCGLDVRVPFCDYRIAEYLYGVPWEYKDYNGKEKGLLRYAMRGLLPDAILYRKKSPYPKTFDPRYTEIVTQKLKDVIADPNSPILQIIRKDSLEKLLCADFPSPWYGQLMRLPQTIAYMLQINRWMVLYHLKVV